MALVAVPMLDEAENAVPLSSRARKISMSDDAALKNREPDFDLIHPRGVLGRIDKVESTAVHLVELGPAFIFAVVVNIEIVRDDIDVAIGVASRKRLHE
jgi:hypothetical protein